VVMASAMPASRVPPIVNHDRATNWRWAEKHKARAVSRRLQNATRRQAKLKAPVERLTMRRHLIHRAKPPATTLWWQQKAEVYVTVRSADRVLSRTLIRSTMAMSGSIQGSVMALALVVVFSLAVILLGTLMLTDRRTKSF
jgi:hypothetical protein